MVEQLASTKPLEEFDCVKKQKRKSDLISRQDAIDAIMELPDCPNGYKVQIIGVLGELPSAEPCDNCIHDAEDWDSEACDGCVKPSAEADLSGYSDRLWKIAYERGKAEAQRKGKWIERTYACKSGNIEMKVCSECQYEYSYDAETGISDANYCPNCGADMRGEEE